MKTYKGQIEKLEPNQIFVFGSNTQGRHGKGAALWAIKHAGALYGQAKGLQGQSYAIITKDLTKQVHPSIRPEYILEQISDFYFFAEELCNVEFLVAYSGTGKNLNGYDPEQMASLFIAGLIYYRVIKRSIVAGIPKNIVFEEEFAKLLIKRAPELKSQL